MHIPYCHSKCAYCDFFSSPNRKDESALVECIISEYQSRKGEIGAPDTMYVGGGTPSILSDQSLMSLFDVFPVSGMREVTIEANPEDVTKDRAELWRSLGINRVSMGVQSFVDSELRIIGRRHTADDACDAVEAIQSAGFDNFSLDLIYGLPGQTLESWKYSLSKLLAISPAHFSAYMLSYEPRTRLTAMLRTGKIKAVSEDAAVKMYEMLISMAQSHGYEHYEISNFSKPRYRAVHNSSYWQSAPYIGLGPSAHSYDGAVRRVNPSNIGTYLSAIQNTGIAYEIEEESKTDIFNDMVITALRTAEGLPFDKIPRRRLRQFLCDAFPYLQSGKLVVSDGNIHIPETHWLVADGIMRDLIQ